MSLHEQSVSNVADIITCLICHKNERIVDKQNVSNWEQSKTSRELKRQFNIFCDYMKLDVKSISFGQLNFLIESFPFCSHNCKEELFRLISLHDEVELLEKRIHKLTTNFCKKILESRNDVDDHFCGKENHISKVDSLTSTVSSTFQACRQYSNRRRQRFEITKRTVCTFRKMIFDRFAVQLSLDKLEDEHPQLVQLLLGDNQENQSQNYDEVSGYQQSSSQTVLLQANTTAPYAVEDVTVKLIGNDDYIASVPLNDQDEHCIYRLENEHSYSLTCNKTLLHFADHLSDETAFMRGDKYAMKKIESDIRDIPKTHNITNRGTVEVSKNIFLYKGQFYFEKVNEKFCCSTCDYSSELKKLMIGHIRYKHLESAKSVCEVCGKCFRHKVHLSIHQTIHSEDLRFACDQCDCKFKTSTFLYKHRKKMHRPQAEPRYQCDRCSKRFDDRTLLKLHLRTHTGETPYECIVCFKKFKTPSQIGRHNKIHTLNNKPFSCETCGLRFSENGSVKRHVREVHEKEPRRRIAVIESTSVSSEI